MPEDISSGASPRSRSNSTKSATPAPRSALPQMEYKPFTRTQLWLYDLLLWFWSVVFDCFFREIRPRGAFRLPKSGPVIFVAAPHANQFVDPIVLMKQVKKEAGRRISFLIAMKSYLHKIIGTLSRVQLAVPVARAQDMLRPATGKIYVDFDSDPLKVKGKGTHFIEECMARGLIALPESLGATEIAEVVSDTELIIRKEFKSSEKVKQLLKQGTRFKVADKIDQGHVYKFVFQHLSAGNCLGIFPEGGSHDRTDMLPLKAGVAIMALGAMKNDPDCNVKIVPCGMNYFNAHRFRSRAVIEFGHPIEIPKELVKKYSNPQTSREAVKELLEIVTNGLRAVTVNCQDYETLMVIQAARRLYAGNFTQYLPLPLVVEMNRRLVLGYETYKDRPEIQESKQKVLEYNKLLKHLYLPDHHVEDCDESHKIRLLPIFIARIITLIFFAVLAFPGIVLFSPVFIISKLFSMKKAKTALANSTVKIKANDVVATWKILISLIIAPLLYSFYASMGTWYCKTHHYMSTLGSVTLWFSLYMLGVLVTYSALITGEQGMDLFKSIRPLYLSIFSGNAISELKQKRKELSEQITEVVNKFGPELFPNDFNLLELKEHLNVTDEIQYIDSDEEEELKTQELRNRRKSQRKAKKKKKLKAKNKDEGDGDGLTLATTPSDSDLSLNQSLSMSDGVSLVNSDMSYTNIPMFSDYSLHANAKNSDVDIKALNSTISMADDFNYKQASTPVSLSRDSSHMELNFAATKLPGSKLSAQYAISSPQKRHLLGEKIRSRIREGRENNSDAS